MAIMMTENMTEGKTKQKRKNRIQTASSKQQAAQVLAGEVRVFVLL